ncbi:MAG: hypothetical protein ACPGR8_01270 [Limisphaerales bacterium]
MKGPGKTRWDKGWWETHGATRSYYSRQESRRLVEHPSVFVDLASAQGLLPCEDGDLTPYCDSQAAETVGIIELINNANGRVSTEEERTARQFVGSQVQYVVEALVARDEAGAYPVVLIRNKPILRMARQLGKVYQVRLLGQHLFAALKAVLRGASGAGHQLVPVASFSPFHFDSSTLYTLPWFVFKTVNQKGDEVKRMAAIRPDIVVGYGGDVHVVEIKTHTELDGQRIEPSVPWSEGKRSRANQFRRDLRQTLIQAVAVWYRVQLNPAKTKVWAHLLDTTAYTAGKAARTETVSIEITPETARTIMFFVVGEQIRQEFLEAITDDLGKPYDRTVWPQIAQALSTRKKLEALRDTFEGCGLLRLL